MISGKLLTIIYPCARMAVLDTNEGLWNPLICGQKKFS